MPARNRKNLAGGIPKPGTTWERLPDSPSVYMKRHFSITERCLDGHWTYTLHTHTMYIGTYERFAEAAKKADSYD